MLALVDAAGLTAGEAPGWPTWRCAARTASCTRRVSCFSPRERWPGCWIRTRTSARPRPSWWSGTARGCWPRPGCSTASPW
ncbi:hypothetical protein ACFQX6_46610 [Streptosporangium lutulentum]